MLDGQTPITPARWTRTLDAARRRAAAASAHADRERRPPPVLVQLGQPPGARRAPGDADRCAGRARRGDGRRRRRRAARRARRRVRLPRCSGDARTRSTCAASPAPSTAHHALHALTDLRAGWIAATDPVARRGFGVVFDPELHRCVWQWMAYGGFRGWYHVIVEPWTAPQPSLADARAAGQARVLAPGEALESEMTGVL